MDMGGELARGTLQYMDMGQGGELARGTLLYMDMGGELASGMVVLLPSPYINMFLLTLITLCIAFMNIMYLIGMFTLEKF